MSKLLSTEVPIIRMLVFLYIYFYLSQNELKLFVTVFNINFLKFKPVKSLNHQHAEQFYFIAQNHNL